MINREDIVFATCYQLAQLIASDWENPPPAVSEAIDMLKPIDEPGGVFWGGASINNPLHLTPSETEPKSVQDAKKLIELRVVTQCFRTIMKHGDGWETESSDVLQKEIVSRIATYEKEANDIINKVPAECNITL